MLLLAAIRLLFAAKVDLTHQVVACDIAIAGGSTASLAAAITAAEAAPELQVCFLEITDWVRLSKRSRSYLGSHHCFACPCSPAGR